MSSIAFNGENVVLKPERWRHIVLRHPELKNAAALILETVAHPDDIYVDSTGVYHALKRINGVSEFLVVIYDGKPEGYIITAYYTSNLRKTRRYKTFRKLKPS
jgi:hypothetical protein